MSNDRIKQYMDALNEFEKALGDLYTIRHIIGDAYRELENPQKFNSQYVAVWPTAKQITDAIANLHQKHLNAEKHWKLLSPDEQNRIEALPRKPITIK